MDKRKSYFIGVDTETANGFIDEEGKTDLSQSLVYDIGWSITDRNGNIYLSRSYIVDEIFFDTLLMNSAYYAEKIPQYLEDIANGKRKISTFKNIFFQFYRDCKKYNCKAIFAHNARFDLNALNNTLRYITGSKNRYFFPYGVEIWDTLKMSRDILGAKPSYDRFCKKNNYLTKHKVPQNRFTAEILYRFISGDNDFIENHTGLEDVEIEIKIFAYCLRQKKKMRKKLFEN